MSERPIIFSAAMVNAIRTGRKTETRRPVRRSFDDVAHRADLDVDWPWREGPDGEDVWAPPRFGVPGDRLWVRETWCVSAWYDKVAPRDLPEARPAVRYPATDRVVGLRKRSSIHMPRWASRLELEVTSVHVERLHAISCWGIRREGFDCPEHDFSAGFCTSECASLRQAFAKGWDGIYGPGSWESNPVVWVVRFERLNSD